MEVAAAAITVAIALLCIKYYHDVKDAATDIARLQKEFKSLIGELGEMKAPPDGSDGAKLSNSFKLLEVLNVCCGTTAKPDPPSVLLVGFLEALSEIDTFIAQLKTPKQENHAVPLIREFRKKPCEEYGVLMFMLEILVEQGPISVPSQGRMLVRKPKELERLLQEALWTYDARIMLCRRMEVIYKLGKFYRTVYPAKDERTLPNNAVPMMVRINNLLRLPFPDPLPTHEPFFFEITPHEVSKLLLIDYPPPPSPLSPSSTPPATRPSTFDDELRASRPYHNAGVWNNLVVSFDSGAGGSIRRFTTLTTGSRLRAFMPSYKSCWLSSLAFSFSPSPLIWLGKAVLVLSEIWLPRERIEGVYYKARD